jgi:hypothetical protein
MCLLAAFVPHRPNKYFPRDSVQRNCFELALYTARDHDCISNRIGSGIRSAMQMSSRYVRCAANDVDDRTDHHANRSSASGPSSSPVAAPYRESGLVLWRKAVSQREIAAELRKGRSRLRALPHCAAAGDRALRCVKRYGGFGTGGLSLRRVDRLFEKAVDGSTSWFDRSR